MRECDELGLALDQNFPSIAFRFLFRPAAERNPPSPSRPRTCISDQLSRPPASRGMYVLRTSTQRLCPPAVDRATDRATDPRIWASSWRHPRFMIRPIIPCHVHAMSGEQTRRAAHTRLSAAECPRGRTPPDQHSVRSWLGGRRGVARDMYETAPLVGCPTDGLDASPS